MYISYDIFNPLADAVLSADPTLTLSNLQRRQSGIYQCVVRNSLGMAYAVARLLVVEVMAPAAGSSAGGQSAPGDASRPVAGGSGTGNRAGKFIIVRVAVICPYVAVLVHRYTGNGSREHFLTHRLMINGINNSVMCVHLCLSVCCLFVERLAARRAPLISRLVHC